jgi:hypothetical protein
MVNAHGISTVNGQINVNFSSNMPKGTYALTLVDAYGKVIRKDNIDYTGNAITKAVTAAQQGGVYMLNISSPTYSHTEKVLVK